MKRTLLLLLTLPLIAQAEPLCLPKDAGGTGTNAISHMVYLGGTVSDKPEDAAANGGTLARGGKAVTWWCPREVFGGFLVWDLEWYGWEFSQDQFLGMQGFRSDNADSVRQAWQASRTAALDRTYFPTNVLLAAKPSQPKTLKVTP